MDDVNAYLPRQVNAGAWLAASTHAELLSRVDRERIVLPICSLGAAVSELAELAPLVLPPLYHEALDDNLKAALLARIRQCFPFYEGTRRRREWRGVFDVVELPREQHAPSPRPRVLAFSVDTAVEEHGPHLPLMTDTIQSYGVLSRLAEEIDGMALAPPVEYGQLTWGLPFGLSIDITAPLVTRYVAGYVNALLDWIAPEALYVVDVHGSIVHRNAICAGLEQSRCRRWAFRWLHDSLVEFSGDRGDQHAGGVETALVHHINEQLVDRSWWPDRINEVVAGQMTLRQAADLSSDLPHFIRHVESGPLNGIVGDVRNFYEIDAELMMQRMLAVARDDVARLLADS